MFTCKKNFLILFIGLSLLIYSACLTKFMRFDNELFKLEQQDTSISGICKNLKVDSVGKFSAMCFGKEIEVDLNECISVSDKGKMKFFQNGDFSKKCNDCKIEEYFEGEKLKCKCLNFLDEKVNTELHLSDNLKHEMKGNKITCEAKKNNYFLKY